jgi:hypothetical protein
MQPKASESRPMACVSSGPTEATNKHGDISVPGLSRMDKPAKPFNKTLAAVDREPFG